MTIKRFVLTNAFRLSMVWDLVATFLGTLIILGKPSFVPIAISLVAALVVGALNFSTQAIWSASYAQRRDFFFQFLLLRVVWVLAIVFDFWTSLTCNALFVWPGPVEINPEVAKAVADTSQLLAPLHPGQRVIVLFVTFVVTVSPMMVGYIRDKDLEFLA